MATLYTGQHVPHFLPTANMQYALSDFRDRGVLTMFRRLVVDEILRSRNTDKWPYRGYNATILSASTDGITSPTTFTAK